VADRRREIGIRMTLGAGRSGVVAQVMKQGVCSPPSGSSLASPARSASTD
jgi:hypothetical protein